MSEINFTSGDFLLALLEVVVIPLTIVAILHVTGQRKQGFFQYFAYAILLSVAVLIFSSGRSLLDFETESELFAQGNLLADWTSHIASLFLMLVSLESIVLYAFRRQRSEFQPRLLVVCFVLFWITTVASPALLGWSSTVSRELFYTLLIGCAALLLPPIESDATVVATRDALLLFLAAGVALIPFRPSLVTDVSYQSGLLHGLPRFAGLAPHAVSLAMLAQLALLCLYAQPLPHRWLNRLAWALGLLCLLLAQSKTTWISFPLCAACIYWGNADARAARRRSAASRALASKFVLLGAVLLIVAIGLTYTVGNLDLKINALVSGQQGADIASLSGRDRIWNAALADWARHPLFGYGNNLFDESYRASIRMPFATNGHNQFVDTLARSGIVGATGLVLYVVALLVFALRYAKSSRGLSLAIFVAIAFRCVSEVPLGLTTYGPELVQQVLLLAILAGCARRRHAPVAVNANPDVAHLAYLDSRSRVAGNEGRSWRSTWG